MEMFHWATCAQSISQTKLSKGATYSTLVLNIHRIVQVKMRMEQILTIKWKLSAMKQFTTKVKVGNHKELIPFWKGIEM